MADKTVGDVMKMGIDSFLKKEKDDKIADTYLTAQIANKEKILKDLELKIATLESRNSTLEKEFTQKNKMLLDSISEKNRKADELLNEAKALKSDAQREMNFVQQEKGVVYTLKMEATTKQNKYQTKLDRLMQFCTEIGRDA